MGGGAVGERKVADLMAAGARVTVVSRTLTPELAALADRGEIRYLPEDTTSAQVEGHGPAVMAATVHRSQRRRERAAAEAGGHFKVNVADIVHLHCPGPGAPGRVDPGHQHRRRQPGPGPPVAPGVNASRSGIRAYLVIKHARHRTRLLTERRTIRQWPPLPPTGAQPPAGGGGQGIGQVLHLLHEGVGRS